MQAFSDIKNYYNDITHNNLDLIKTLKEDVADMKKKENQNEKLMFEIAQENKRLSEPLQKVKPAFLACHNSVAKSCMLLLAWFYGQKLPPHAQAPTPGSHMLLRGPAQGAALPNFPTSFCLSFARYAALFNFARAWCRSLAPLLLLLSLDWSKHPHAAQAAKACFLLCCSVALRCIYNQVAVKPL